MSVLLGHPPSIRHGIKNHCGQLEVGREYEMRREQRVPDILSIDGSRIALTVEGSSKATETRAFAGQSVPIKTKFFAGHSNRTSVLFRPQNTPTNLLRCAASSKSRSQQLPS